MRLAYFIRQAIFSIAGIATVAAAQAPTASGSSGSVSPGTVAVLPLTPDQVVTHARLTVDWFRRVCALQQLPVDPDDVVGRDRLSQSATTALQLAFDFGRAAAALVASIPKESSGAPTAGQTDAKAADTHQEDLEHAAAKLADRTASLESQLTTLDAQIPRTPEAQRQTLTAQRAEITAALAFSREVQGTLQQLAQFEEHTSVSAGASSGLAAQIADLQRSVPEVRHSSVAVPRASASGGSTAAASASAAASSSVSATAAPSPAFRPETAGVIALVTQWFALGNSRGELRDALSQTESLQVELDSLRSSLSKGARSLAREYLDAAPGTDPSELAQARQQLDAASAQFKGLSTVLVPLGEQSITLDSVNSILTAWRNSVAARASGVVRHLMLRLGLLLGSIGVVLLVSDIWRRATFRYLHDSRRRRQFLALRRVAVSLALTLVIVFGLVSEVGSVATYAGLITAGLAVALQNVILAVVAYFFLIGRYGVRVGDRITLASVTGRVVDIGLIRIYLMELTGPELRPSGRMVVLSNAVLFQPTALFKQMPGGDYLWHTAMLTLAASADVQDADTRLREAANSVYEHYRPVIEQQHAALQKFIDFETVMPQPEVSVRLTDKGLECAVRYPVDPSRGASIDQKMLAALQEAIGRAPELTPVSGPLLQSSQI